MSEDKKIPGPPPPDDFSKTTPNINVAPDSGGQNDWDKTNYNFPKQPAADDWGKTVTNLKPIDTENQDFGKTFYPGSQPAQPPSGDWGVTNANVNVSAADLGSAPEDFGGGGGYDKTTPYFRLPEAERSKYQDLPPTPTEKAEQEKKEKAEQGGIPGWVWVAGGLLSMFLFAIAVLLFVYFFLIRDTYFEATVKLAPPGSRVLVDDKQIGYTKEDGSITLPSLTPGTRTIKIVHPNFDCKPQEIKGEAGVKTEPIVARCEEIKVAPEDCKNIGMGEFDKAERCYYTALNGLGDPFTEEELVNALNILIINFDSGKFDIPNDRLAALKKGADYIKRLKPEVVLEIGGHTDNKGDDASNQKLSENRANAVKTKLITFGVRGEVLQTKGYGSTSPRPGADNNTEQGRFFNRRIQYSIVKK